MGCCPGEKDPRRAGLLSLQGGLATLGFHRPRTHSPTPRVSQCPPGAGSQKTGQGAVQRSVATWREPGAGTYFSIVPSPVRRLPQGAGRNPQGAGQEEAPQSGSVRFPGAS